MTVDRQSQVSQNAAGVAWLLAFIVISLAIVGYFIGLQAPMPEHDLGTKDGFSSLEQSVHLPINDRINGNNVIPATAYANMADLTRQRMLHQQSTFSQIDLNINLLREFTVSDQEKKYALELRALNRAFNESPQRYRIQLRPCLQNRVWSVMVMA
ncbi:MAG: hypothetical protein R3C03_21715 [Pirellulaceae bacterium]